MTENEAIKIINDKYETFFALSTTNDFDMAMATAIKTLEEIQQYRAIGTIEEFKDLKEKSVADEVKENNKQLVCEIKIDTEILQKIIDETVAQIELDIQGIRAKAIDEFAKQLKSDEFQKYNLDMVFETSRDLSYSHCINAFHEYVDEIAEQLKEGGKNE